MALAPAPLTPLDVAPLFRPLLARLLDLLRGLALSDWERLTVAPGWRVRDVAAHLLDGDLRKIAAYRDDHSILPAEPITSDAALARFINGLNASGVAYAGRLSPRLLTDLLAVTGEWTAAVIDALDPSSPSLFPVSWAGEHASQNWMDTGREYTERWHHQAQIRDAVGAPRLLEPEWFEPLLAFSVKALPSAYGNVEAEPGTTVTLAVEGATSDAWSLTRDTAAWRLWRGAAGAPSATLRIDCDQAWRLLYNALPDDAARRLRAEGDPRLIAPLLKARSVIL